MVFRPQATSHSTADCHPQVLRGIHALAMFLVKQVKIMENHREEEKSRRAVYDRIPNELAKVAPSLARELMWRVEALLGGEMDGDEDVLKVSSTKTQKTRNPKSPVDTTPRSDRTKIVFAACPRIKHLRPATPWAIVSSSEEESSTVISRPRPTVMIEEVADKLKDGTESSESATELVSVTRQIRKRYREASGGLVEEHQEVSVVSTITKWQSVEEVDQKP